MTIHIRIELWMWLGENPGGGFQALSEMRSGKEMEAEDGVTVLQLFEQMAAQSPLIGEKVFDRKLGRFHPNLTVIVTHDGQVVSPFQVEKDFLKDGDKITVLPLYVGG